MYVLENQKQRDTHKDMHRDTHTRIHTQIHTKIQRYTQRFTQLFRDTHTHTHREIYRYTHREIHTQKFTKICIVYMCTYTTHIKIQRYTHRHTQREICSVLLINYRMNSLILYFYNNNMQKVIQPTILTNIHHIEVILKRVPYKSKYISKLEENQDFCSIFFSVRNLSFLNYTKRW